MWLRSEGGLLNLCAYHGVGAREARKRAAGEAWENLNFSEERQAARVGGSQRRGAGGACGAVADVEVQDIRKCGAAVAGVGGGGQRWGSGAGVVDGVVCNVTVAGVGGVGREGVFRSTAHLPAKI